MHGSAADRWVAVPAGADLVSHARRLERAHERAVGDGTGSGGDAGAGDVRDVIAASWRRCTNARVDPGRAAAPHVLDDEALDARRARHPLVAAGPHVADLLDEVAEDAGHLVALGDADGVLLSVHGPAAVRRRASAMAFEAGADWSERAAGTNAVGTALAAGHAVQVFSAEHYRRSVHPWTCAAAPVRDLRTGRTVGVIDLTGALRSGHPHTLALVRTAARAVERMLITLGPSAGPSADRGLGATLLGTDRPSLRGPDGRTVPLPGRQAEVLALLLRHPEGRSAPELALDLWGEDGSPDAVRPICSRLRAALGDALASRPYRLTAPVASDLGEVLTALEAGDLASALHAASGPLLPRSDAPAVRRLADDLHARLRGGVLGGGSPTLLAAWTRSPLGDEDLVALEALADALPAATGQAADVRARADVLRRHLGLAPAAAPGG